MPESCLHTPPEQKNHLTQNYFFFFAQISKKIHTFAFGLIIQTIKRMEKKTHYTCKAERKTGRLHRKADIQRHPDEVHKNELAIDLLIIHLFKRHYLRNIKDDNV